MPGKRYPILDNGAVTFLVEVLKTRINIYKNKYDKETGELVFDKKIYSTPYKKVFIGNDPRARWPPGNSVLINVSKNKYISCGMDIYEFETDEDIEAYYSPIGNSAVPYPYAISNNYVYFTLEKQLVNKAALDMSKDLYQQFYRTVAVADKKKMKIRVIQKRFL
jgi:hypothetical protein